MFPYNRIHNFAAGPAILPLKVVEKVRDNLLNLNGSGIGLMEISHRSKTFDAVCRNAQALLKKVLDIPDGYEVLFLQGGASLQFLMAPMNLLNAGEKADYLVTGGWSQKALKEAKTQGDCIAAWTDEANNFKRVPRNDEYTVREDAVFLHYTNNNTLFGTEFLHTPEGYGKPLVADASSDFCSRPLDVAKHVLIYAGAQKNVGPSGVTVVIVKKDFLDRCTRKPSTMLDYRIHIKKETMYNTPCCVGIYTIEQVLQWVLDEGGLPAIEARNKDKAARLYAELDRTAFWKPHANPDSRSRMNVTWRIADPALEEVFVKEATAVGLNGLKGHRDVGGLRASIYNACPVEAVDALVAFMKDFESRKG